MEQRGRDGGTLYTPRRDGRVVRLLGVVVILAAAAAVGWTQRARLASLWHRISGHGGVSIWLEVVPKEARVYLDGAEIESRALHLERSEEVFTILVVAPGFRTQKLRVMPDSDQTHRIVLERAPRRSRPPPRVGATGRCPPQMRLVATRGDAYCVDRFEHPGKDKAPTSGIGLEEARGLCHARGARLCSVEEWVRVCGERFPYGESYDPARCNTGRTALVPTGSRPKCVSSFGVHDLSGNVSEWVEEGVVMGGDARQEEGHASCRASSVRGGALAGCRCCADPSWD